MNNNTDHITNDEYSAQFKEHMVNTLQIGVEDIHTQSDEDYQKHPNALKDIRGEQDHLWMNVKTKDTADAKNVIYYIQLCSNDFREGIEFYFVQTTANHVNRKYFNKDYMDHLKQNTMVQFKSDPHMLWMIDAPVTSLQYDVQRRTIIDITGKGIDDAVQEKQVWRCPFLPEESAQTEPLADSHPHHAVLLLQWALQQSVVNLVTGEHKPRRLKMFSRMMKFIYRGFHVPNSTIRLLCQPLLLMANCLTHSSAHDIGIINKEMLSVTRKHSALADVLYIRLREAFNDSDKASELMKTINRLLYKRKKTFLPKCLKRRNSLLRQSRRKKTSILSSTCP